MKNIFLVSCAVILGIQHGYAEETVVAIDPFSAYAEAILDTKLLGIEVLVWDMQDNPSEEGESFFERELQRSIAHRFAQRGLDPEVCQNMELQPAYEQYQALYTDQLNRAAVFLVSVYRKEQAIFIDMWCLKNCGAYALPIYARSFCVSNDEHWRFDCQTQILEHVEEFLEQFTAIHPGPYGWVIPDGS
ncbi:MAG: hypothetical protein KGZ39_00730 [Simkania sp.]|nr:hypothetical protein [Simkania sp.]